MSNIRAQGVNQKRQGASSLQLIEPGVKRAQCCMPIKMMECSGTVLNVLGSNKFASQKGMSIGSVRHVSDIKTDDFCQEGQGVINLQSGKEVC